MRRKLLWSLTVLVGAVATVVLLRAREPDLLSNAVRMPYVALGANGTVYSCASSSSDEIVMLKSFSFGSETPITRLNIKSGKSADFTVKGVPWGDPGFNGMGPFSPDGRWLLHFTNSDPGECVLVDLVKSRATRRKGRGLGWPTWSNDSQGWLRRSLNGDFCVYEIQAPKVRIVKPAKPVGDVELWYDRNREYVVTYHFAGEDVSPTEFYETSLAGRPTSERLGIRIPTGAVISEAELSADGRHVLWWLEFRKPKSDWLERLLTWFHRPASTAPNGALTEGIWISRPDGSDFKALGRVKAEPAPEGLHAVGWMPDSSRVFFFYKHGMYIKPIE